MEWLAVPGYDGLYEVNELGEVRSLDRIVADQSGKRSRLLKGRALKPQKNGNGFHFHVGLAKDGQTKTWYIHDIVAMTYIGQKPDGQEVRHKDCNGYNNRRDNIEYGTRSQNRQDSIEAGTIARGETHAFAKLTELEVMAIKMATGSGEDLAKRFGVSRRSIDLIRSGHHWRHVKIQPEVTGNG